MKKVLIITRPIVPPWDEASKNFVNDLARRINSVELSVLTNKTWTTDNYPNTKLLRIYGSNQLDKRQKLNLFKLTKKIKNYNLVHFFFTPNRTNSFISKKLLSNKNTKTIQTIASLDFSSYEKKSLKNLLFADIIITYSDFTKNKLNNFGFNNTKRIYPGINLKSYRPSGKSKDFQKKFGLRENDFVITYPGEYHRLGTTDLLVDILPELVKSIPNLKFIFACRVKDRNDQIKKSQVIDNLESLGLENKVIHTGTITNMPELYNSSDLILFPVKSMAGKFDLPLVIVEAMACEKPLIVSDLEILSEFVSPNRCMSVRAGNKNDLIEAITKLSRDEKLRTEISQNAKIYAEQNFSIDLAAKEYEKLYESIK